jgi:hypothetical protein
MSKWMKQQAYPCAAIPEFDAYRRHQPLVKQALLAETGGTPAAFVERAAQTLAECVLVTPVQTPGRGRPLLLRLYHQGHHREQILSALAEAWYTDSEVFFLPVRAWWLRWLHSGWVVWGVPLTVALGTTMTLVLLGRTLYPRLTGKMLFLEPLLALVGLTIAFVVHLILEWLSKRL